MQETAENKEILTGLITCVDVQKLFSRSDQSIAIWRKSYGLPYVVIPSEGRAAVRYRLTKIIEWAKTAGKELDAAYLKHLKSGIGVEPAAMKPGTKKSPPRRRFVEIAK